MAGTRRLRNYGDRCRIQRRVTGLMGRKHYMSVLAPISSQFDEVCVESLFRVLVLIAGHQSQEVGFHYNPYKYAP